MKFWLKLELLFEQVHNENVSRKSSSETLTFSISRSKDKSNSVTEQPLEKTIKEFPNINISSKSLSNPIKTPNIFRSITPTLPSFSQNTNVINVTFNYSV
ncbi:hypothetical protein C1645_820218 [Glomus cerebriforme]|uniref:Uncharacterized protein n=1 Tax=Glomus cerebriforme TaxID=658196 RepID=A0A397TD29_9GLOM|nr:hypothetical protein C1645_820218 [Glomus cerebriforme]